VRKVGVDIGEGSGPEEEGFYVCKGCVLGLVNG